MHKSSLKLLIYIFFIFLSYSNLYCQNNESNHTIYHLDELFGDSTAISHHVNILYTNPLENQVVYHKNIQLNWQKSGSSLSKLQVSTDENFTNIIVDTTIIDQQFNIQSLEKHKDYFWRVYDPTSEILDIKNGSFFKTSAIQLDDATNTTIDVIPTWLDGQDVLFLDNPSKLKYVITVVDEKDNIITKKYLALEKYIISTSNWKNGMYKILLEYNGLSLQTKYFMLR